MVLCVIDDLIFSVKISTAAKALAVPIYFERTAGSAPARARELQPSLIILDLNSAKLQPLDTITALKADPALAAVWWMAVVLRGVLPALFGIAMGLLVAAVQKGTGLAVPLNLPPIIGLSTSGGQAPRNPSQARRISRRRACQSSGVRTGRPSSKSRGER